MSPFATYLAQDAIMKKTHVFNPKHVAVLEMEQRRLWENPDQILGLVKIRPNFIAADLGCGSGFFTLPLAKKVKKIYAIDVQKEMLEILEQKIRKQKIRNIELVLSKENEIPLENESVEFLISVNTLHEFSDKERMIKEMQRVLKPKGEVLIVDFKKENTGFGPPVAIRISKEQAIISFEKNGLSTLKSMDLPFHYALVFCK
jgi:ubiquinone/menaquinone biosynthesis C-methylase UbiE